MKTIWLDYCLDCRCTWNWLRRRQLWSLLICLPEEPDRQAAELEEPEEPRAQPPAGQDQRAVADPAPQGRRRQASEVIKLQEIARLRDPHIPLPERWPS